MREEDTKAEQEQTRRKKKQTEGERWQKGELREKRNQSKARGARARKTSKCGVRARTETALPARGLSGLQAAEQWQETSAWNFSLPAGMRALIQDLVAPRRPAVNRDVTASFLRAAPDRPGRAARSR